MFTQAILAYFSYFQKNIKTSGTCTIFFKLKEFFSLRQSQLQLWDGWETILI